MMGVVGKNFPDPQKIEDTVKIVSKAADESGIQIALAGGVAMQFYGSPRFTQDVDFVADGAPQDLPKMTPILPLTFGGRKYKTASGVEADLIVRSDGYASLYGEALAQALVWKYPIRVVQPEFLAAMKLAAAREKDHLDLVWLVQQGVIDLAWTEKIVSRYLGGQFAVEEFLRVVDEAKWRASKVEGR